MELVNTTIYIFGFVLLVVFIFCAVSILKLEKEEEKHYERLDKIYRHRVRPSPEVKIDAAFAAEWAVYRDVIGK